MKNKSVEKPSAIKKKQAIIKAALKEFSQVGLEGARLEQIAENAQMSKSNLFYYFKNKEALYVMVLENVLTEWLLPLNELTVTQDPKVALSHYIQVKYALSKKSPEASKLYALEIIQGAPYLQSILKGSLKKLIQEKVAVIDEWIRIGKLQPIAPLHLILHIWAITQHYADFNVQIQAISNKSLANKPFAQAALDTTLQLLVNNLVIENRVSPELPID